MSLPEQFYPYEAWTERCGSSIHRQIQQDKTGALKDNKADSRCLYGYLAPFSLSLDGNLNAGEGKDASPFWMTTLFSGSEGLDREWPHDGLK